MKVYKETVRKYYKYKDWQQPILTSNTSTPSFTVSATNEGQGAAWQAFDGNTSSGWATANNVTTGTLTAVLDKDIYITSIEVVGLSNQYGSTNTIVIYSDANKQTIIGEQKSFNYSVSNTLVWTFEKPVKAKTLVFYGTGKTWVSVREITITAQEQVTVESPQANYDFSEAVDVYSLPTKQVPIYEKYENEYLDTLPTYASAAQGEAGINGISFSPSAMYFCVAQTKQSTVTNSLDYKVVWDFGGREFKLDTCTYQNYVVNLRTPAASLKTIEGSNDGTNWTTVTAPVATYYKFYRFKFSGSETNKYGAMGMKYFNLTGSLRKKVVSTKGQPVEYVTQYLGIL